jgi:hypothetical protein
MKDNVKRIQVPNKYIDNKKFHFNAFYLYVNLKMICVDNHVKIYSKKLLEKLDWTKYSLKVYLNVLIQENLILFDFNDLPIHNPIELNIEPINTNPAKKEDYFTQVDVETIKKIFESARKVKYKTKDGKTELKDEKEKALKLFYLYEMYYNENYNKSFINYDGIYNATGYKNNTIKNINNMFHKNHLVDVMLGDWYEKEIDEDVYTPTRERNNYIPNCNRKSCFKNTD